MSQYIKLYFTDNDIQVEPSGNSVGEPISYALRADLNAVGDWTGLYVLAMSGYTCSGVEVAPIGTTYLKWQLNSDIGGGSSPSGNPEDYGGSLVVGDVGSVNKVYFHIRAKATDDEVVSDDETVLLNVYGIVSVE